VKGRFYDSVCIIVRQTSTGTRNGTIHRQVVRQSNQKSTRRLQSAGTPDLEAAPAPRRRLRSRARAGYFAIELAKLGHYRITGLDISQTFVEIAQRNARQAHVQDDFQRGNASGMPFKNESFNFLLCRAAFKNFGAPLGALGKMHRVLKPGGRALITDLRKDSSNESVSQAVDEMKLGTVNRILTKATFRFMLLKRAYTKSDFEQMVADTHFDKVEIRDSLTQLEISLSKSPIGVHSRSFAAS
jgi:SAM-dependent methyltransferase